jgi:hypothetical protein
MPRLAPVTSATDPSIFMAGLSMELDVQFG